MVPFGHQQYELHKLFRIKLSNLPKTKPTLLTRTTIIFLVLCELRIFLFFRKILPKAKDRPSTFNPPHQHHPNLVSIVNTACIVVSFVSSRLSRNTHVSRSPCFALVTQWTEVTLQTTSPRNSCPCGLQLFDKLADFFVSFFSCTNQFGSYP